MKIVARAEARQLGLIRYFTGIPCKRGHITERIVSSQDCLICLRDRLRRSRRDSSAQFKQYEQARDRKRTNALARSRYKTSRKKRTSNALWRKAHRERANSYARTSYWANIERSRKEQMIKMVRRRARLQALDNTLTRTQFETIIKLQKNRCAIDGIGFTKHNPPTIDHIIPLVKGGPTTAKNTQAVCRICNRSKHTHFMEDYMRTKHGRLL